MIAHDRRYGFRVPTEIFLNQYIEDEPYRALSVNVSETGIYTNTVISPISRTNRTIGVEFELPDTNESIWARAEVRYDSLDDLFHGQGIRFTGMAKSHKNLLRDYCIEKRRAHLANMLDQIRRNRWE